jgi:hypothetical protein
LARGDQINGIGLWPVKGDLEDMPLTAGFDNRIRSGVFSIRHLVSP